MPRPLDQLARIVERFGHATRAFMVAAPAGAFFIDFTNALIITGFSNFVRCPPGAG